MIVKFLNESGTLVTKEFDSEYICRKFVNKVKRSKKLKLVQYPNFSW